MGLPPRRAAALAVCVAAVALGCGYRGPVPDAPNLTQRLYGELLSYATEHLECPRESITHAYQDTGAHRMSGCGRRMDYFLACTSTCEWLPAPLEAAAFTLGCSVDQIAVRQLSDDRLGATGCGGRITYLAICDMATCSWVQEGSTAATESRRAAEQQRQLY